MLEKDIENDFDVCSGIKIYKGEDFINFKCKNILKEDNDDDKCNSCRSLYISIGFYQDKIDDLIRRIKTEL